MLDHHCSKPQFFMIKDLSTDKPNFDPIQIDLTPPTQIKLTPESDIFFDNPSHAIFGTIQTPTKTILEISFHAFTGNTHPKTIRMLGQLQNKTVTILFYGGNMHNFIDQHVVSKFGLHVVQDRTFQVMVANREIINCVSRCLGLTLVVQGYSITVNFYVLPVAACQAVFKVQ